MAGTPRPASPSDDALCLALQIWEPARAGQHARTWRKLHPDWRAHLMTRTQATPSTEAGQLPLARLRDNAQRESRLEPAAIHPSWWQRALQDESPAVRNAVLLHAPVEIVARLGGVPETTVGRPHQSEALATALCLWTERLVGGPPLQPEDAAVVHSIVRSSSTELVRVLIWVALLKLVQIETSQLAALPHWHRQMNRARHRARCQKLEAVRLDFEPSDGWAKFAHWDARQEQERWRAQADSRRMSMAGLGLISMARLLGAVPTHRARWALQHLPYSMARPIRVRMSLANPLVTATDLLRWESSLWQVAEELATSERRSRSAASDPMGAAQHGDAPATSGGHSTP